MPLLFGKTLALLPSALEKTYSLFSHESKVRNLNYHLNDHSNDGILDRVYAKLHRDASFEMRNSNDDPEVFSSCASLKLRSKIAV